MRNRGRSSKALQYLSISLVLHVGLFSVLIGTLHGLLPLPAVPRSRLIEVGLYHSAEPHRTQGRPSERRHIQNLPRKPEINLKDLGVFLKGGLTQNSATEPLASEGGGGSPYAFRGQLTEKASPVLNYLYHRINHNIGYPSELYDAWLQGDITSVLRFDRQGRWIDDPSAVQAQSLGSRYLRIHVIRRLRTILAEPIPENIWKTTTQPFSVEARFVFAIIAPEGVEGAQIGPLFGATADPTKFNETDTDGGQSVEAKLNTQNQGAYGNSFLFYHSHLASKLAWKLGPFAGYSVMPAVGVDPEWFVKTISDWIHHRTKINPLDKYRDDPDW